MITTNTQKVAFNTIIQFLGKAITVATSLVIIAYLTRYLGAAGYGDYATIFAYLGVFGVVMDMGLLVATVRELTAEPEKEQNLLKNVFGLKLVSGVIILLFALLISNFLPYGQIIKQGILYGTLTQLAMSINQVPVSFLQAKLVLYKSTIADVVGRVTLLGLIWWLIINQAGILQIVLATAAAGFIVFAINALMLPQKSWLIPGFDINIWKKILIKAVPLGIVTTLGVIFFKFDVLILAGYFDSAVVGIYQAPYKILEVFLFVPSVFMGIVLPLLTLAWVRSKEDVVKILQKSVNFLAILSFPIMLGLIALGTPIMLFVAGQEFALSGPVLQGLSLLLVLSFVNAAFIYTVIAADSQQKLIKPYLLATIFNIGANFIFIPVYSYWAAIIITILTEVIVFIAAWRLVSKDLGLSVNWSVSSKAMVNSLIMFGIISALSPMSMWFVIGVAIISYAALSLLTKTIKINDIKELISRNV
ncbi:MAG: flippase [Patescibacteria group bacterium]|nr:flippase [Patescibacteria group bacterium]